MGGHFPGLAPHEVTRDRVAQPAAGPRQTAIACGQRVWKRQPEGGFSALGMSPASRSRVFRPRSARLDARPAPRRSAYACKGAAGWRRTSAFGDLRYDQAASCHRHALREDSAELPRWRPARRSCHLAQLLTGPVSVYASRSARLPYEITANRWNNSSGAKCPQRSRFDTTPRPPSFPAVPTAIRPCSTRHEAIIPGREQRP